MVTIVNLTPHKLSILDIHGNKKNLPPSGMVARINEEKVLKTNIFDMDLGEFEVATTVVHDIIDLPEENERPNTIYVVSKPVAMVIDKDRSDIYYPGELIRDCKGNVVCCNGLCRY